MGTGECRGDGVAVAMMHQGCWSEADPLSVQTDIRGQTHNPNQGVCYSKPAGLALSQAGHLF